MLYLDLRATFEWRTYEHFAELDKFVIAAQRRRDGGCFMRDCDISDIYDRSDITDVASYNVRSFSLTARRHTRSRSKIGDMGVVVSRSKKGAKHFFPAIVDQFLVFKIGTATHRVARIFPYVGSSESHQQAIRVRRLHKDSLVTDPIAFAECSECTYLPLIRNTKPMFVAVTRIFGLLVTLPLHKLDKSNTLIRGVVALRGYFPWYKPGRFGCQRACLRVWNFAKEGDSCI